MAVKQQYRQCRLSRDNGKFETTSFIPAKLAKVGRVLDLRDPDGSWTTDWTVQVASHIVEDPRDPHELIKNHRRATGDSQKRLI